MLNMSSSNGLPIESVPQPTPTQRTTESNVNWELRALRPPKDSKRLLTFYCLQCKTHTYVSTTAVRRITEVNHVWCATCGGTPIYRGVTSLYGETKPIKHGTPLSYISIGCRCEACTIAGSTTRRG